NDEYYLDQDFTNDLNKMREALEKVDTRGGTALYDAVVASSDHLKKNAKLEKRVLFVVTDGEDNESQETLEQAIRRLQEENGPTVYAIGLLGEEKQRRARKALQLSPKRRAESRSSPGAWKKWTRSAERSRTISAINTRSDISRPIQRVRVDIGRSRSTR